MPLVVRTLSDQIYDVLRQRIVMHDIRPGEMIRQDVIATELGASKIPVREALARLQGSGMVLSAANRGFIAAPLSTEEADDIFSLRALIEPPTVAETALEAGDSQRAEVAEALEYLLAGKADFRSSMNSRRRMMLSLLIQKRRPMRAAIMVQLYDRAERYHSVDPDFLAMDSLKTLVSAWLDRDAAAVHSAYHTRLAHRARLVRDALA